MTVAGYFKKMAKYDDDLVEMALDRAADDHREWFPTCGQLLDIVDMLKRTRRVGESHRLIEGEPFSDPEVAKERIGEILKSLGQDKGMPERGPRKPLSAEEIQQGLEDEKANKPVCNDCRAQGGICDEHMPF